MLRIILALLCAFAPGILLANTFTFTVGDLTSYIERSRSSGDKLSLLIGEQIEDTLNAANISLKEGGLLFDADFPDITESGCSKDFKASSLHASVKLDSASKFKFVLEKLKAPIVASADLSGDLDASGRLKLKFGFKLLGTCVRYYSDSGSFDYNAKFHMTLDVKIMLNPEPDPTAGENAIKITPQVYLDGDFISYGGDLNISGLDNPFRNILGPIGSILIQKAKNKIESQVGGMSIVDINNEYDTILADQQKEIQDGVIASLGGVSKTYVLPDIDDKTLKQIGALLHDADGFLPVTFDYLKINKKEILYALLIGDRDRLNSILGGSLACQASQSLLANMPVSALPQNIPFQNTSYAHFCNTGFGSEKLGNAEDTGMLPLNTWTLTPGTRLDVGVKSIAGQNQPYMQRVKYLEREVIDHYENDYALIRPKYDRCMSMLITFSSSLSIIREAILKNRICLNNLMSEIDSGAYMTVPVKRGDGTCSLEMRVYKKDIAATGLKPLIAIHGGSWKYRGFGFFGLESQVSHYTDQGFVVFAPFYRLAGESDGNIECNGAVASDITSDIEEALDWVKTNASSYGATGPVNVMGQSAGAHLAGWLMTKRPVDIDRALLMYPPTDFRDIIDEYNYGNYTNKGGIDTIEGFLGQKLNSVDINSDLVVENSFPGIIAQNPASYPESFILHGVADGLVPSRQSVRLCNGYSGNVLGSAALNDGGNPASGTYKRTYSCDAKTQLHLFAEASHVFDICVPGMDCLGGSKPSQDAINYSLNEAVNWLHGDVYLPWLVPIITLTLLN